MDDLQDEGAVDTVADDNANEADQRDRYYGSPEEAAAAIADDDEGDAPEESPADQPAEPEDDEPAAGEDAAEEPDAGTLRMADYTRKTQELARERESVAQMRDENTHRSSLTTRRAFSASIWTKAAASHRPVSN